MVGQVPMFNWVDENKTKIGFGIQAVPRPDDPDATQRILAAGHLAEELGYDAFFLGDHPAYSSECWVHLAALAVTTRRIRLGSVVNCALYRNPVLTARLTADLDQLSDGRAILGLGAGWNKTEFAQLGIPFPATRDRFRALAESIQIINGVWGATPFSFHGDVYQIEAENVFPPPRQQPRPPLIVAGGGEHVTLNLVATYADACNFGAGDATGGARTADDIARKFAALRRHALAAGRSYDTILRTHFTSWAFVAPTDAAADAKLRRFHPNGLSEVQRLTRVAGNPATVAAYYQSLVDAGFEYFVIQTQDAADLETIRLLATEVLPRLKRDGASAVEPGE